MRLHSNFSVSVLAAMAALSVGVASAASTDVKVGEVGTIEKSYGRAGGLVGADRIAGLRLHTPANAPLDVSWDAEIAARTNMPSDRGAGAVGVTYDQAIAERTNMQRGTPAAKAAGIPGARAN